MHVVGLVLFIIHIIAFVVGGANSVVMPLIGPKMATASPDTRAALTDLAEKLSKTGKWAMLTLLVTGVLVLWLKWDWAVPNVWFWIKMAFVAAMLVFISLNEVNARKARAGDAAAARQAAQFGQFTAIAFLGVIISAIFAFN